MSSMVASVVLTAQDRASKIIQGVKNKIESIENQSKQSFNKAGEVARGFASSVASVAKRAGVASTAVAGFGIKSAASLEQTRMSFQTMLGDVDKAKEMMKSLSDFAAKTPFEFPEVANAGKSLLAFGFEAEKVQDNLRKVGDIASSLNIPLNDLTEIYGKARVQGRLFSEDINQLTGRGIPIIQELAKQMGVAESSIKDMVENGKIGFPELEKAFTSMTDKGGQFANGMANQSQTLNGMFSTFKDTVAEVVRGLVGMSATGEIIKGGLFDKLKTGLEMAQMWLTSNQETIKQWGANIQLVVTTVAAKFTEFVSWLLPYIQGALTQLTEFWNKYGNDIIQTLTFLFEFAKGVFEEAMKGWALISEVGLKAIGKIFEVFAALIRGDWGKLWDNIKALVSGTLDIIQSLLNSFLGFVGGFGGQLVDGFVGAFNKVSESVVAIVNNMAQMIKDIVIGVINRATGQFTGILDKVANIKSTIEQGVQGFGTDIGKSLRSGIDELGANIASGIGMRASGGPVSSGSPYIVGEKGPELFVPNSSGTIVPNNQMSSNITINMGGVAVNNQQDADMFANVIVEKIQRNLQFYNLGVR